MHLRKDMAVGLPPPGDGAVRGLNAGGQVRLRRPEVDGYHKSAAPKKQKGGGRVAVALFPTLRCDLIESGVRHPIAQTQTFADLAALAAGLLNLRSSRRNGAKRMLVNTHGINHVAYFHQDWVPFGFGILSEQH
jgi:hypothetical protein